jgi:hypothetical protein
MSLCRRPLSQSVNAAVLTDYQSGAILYTLSCPYLKDFVRVERRRGPDQIRTLWPLLIPGSVNEVSKAFKI